MSEAVCMYCHHAKPDMVRVKGQYICYECAVERSDCKGSKR